MDGNQRDLPTAGMFAAIGHTPNTAFLNGKLKTNPKGYLTLSTPFRTYTSVAGVFAAGNDKPSGWARTILLKAAKRAQK